MYVCFVKVSGMGIENFKNYYPIIAEVKKSSSPMIILANKSMCPIAFCTPPPQSLTMIQLCLFCTGDGILCIGKGYKKCPGWASKTSLVSFSSLVGSSAWDGISFDAFMTKDSNFDGMFAFTGDYVTEIDIDPANETIWTLYPKLLIRSHPMWSGAPTDVIAAGWIRRRLYKAVDTSYAVLFTNTHMYIYRTSDHSIVYRNQICI